MAAKKSNPDAMKNKSVPIGHALNRNGKSFNSQEPKIELVFNSLNRPGGKSSGAKKKDPLAINGTHEPKTEVSIPSVKTMKSNYQKQESENDAINKKRRGGY